MSDFAAEGFVERSWSLASDFEQKIVPLAHLHFDNYLAAPVG